MTTPTSTQRGPGSANEPRLPSLEAARLAALHGIGLLDTPPSEPIDRITALAAQVLDVPIALVSLIDERRQWYMARVGVDLTETHRDTSFCAKVVDQRRLLNISDAANDPRFAANPLVTGAPHIRAYLGVPVYSRAGHALGTLCAIDVRARRFDRKDVQVLTQFAKIVEDWLHTRELTQRLRSITDNVPVMIGYWNRDLQCEFANDAYQEMFRLKPKWCIGASMRALLGDGHFSSIEPLARRALAGKPQHYVRRNVKSDGSAAFVEVRFIPDVDTAAHVSGFFVLASDVTEARNARIALEATNEKLARESTTDFLTGLSNRRVFSERSEAASRRFQDAGEVYGLILMDLDDFKQVNDVHGHDVGDEVLRAVGKVLRDQLRCDRDIAARLGGEEFAILVFGDPDRDAMNVIAERVREQVAAAGVDTPRGLLRFTGSFGVALCSAGDTGWKNIYARADAALYAAKAAGKNRVQFGKVRPRGPTGRERTLKIVSTR